MADDTMEISSEHGLNPGEEEIDIDIDFTTAQADEDYVLEDVTSQVGFGESFATQPAQGDYDPMVDDEDGSYSMVDADLTHEGSELHMYDGAVDHSFRGPDTSHFVNDLLVFDNGNDFTGEDEEGWDHHDTTESQSAVVDTYTTGRVAEEDFSHQENTSTYLPGSEETHLSATTDTELEAQQKRSSLISSYEPPKPALDSIESKRDHIDADLIQAVGRGVIDKPPEPNSGESATRSALGTEVVVVYQSMEYALFSTNDSDDPDSFFLSDLSIAEKSLVELFSAIRQVILEDLSEEDELCLSVQDLGLEIEENSSMAGNITIAQVTTLYTMLQHNDAVQSPRTLCILLATRPNFVKRLNILTAGATEGKGLSQLVSWDGESNSAEEDVGGIGEEHETRSAVNEVDSHPGEDLAEDLESVDGAQTSGLREDARTGVLDAGELPESNDADTANASEHEAAVSALKADGSETEPRSSKQTLSGNGYDEDGDIIDYSDEEDEDTYKQENAATPTAAKPASDGVGTNNGIDTTFLPLCLKPHTCFCSKCNDLLLAEYEAINEELRRRSISRADDGDDGNHVEDEEEGLSLPEVHNGDQQGDCRADDGVDYEDGENEEQFKNASIEHEGLNATNCEAHGSAGYSESHEGILDSIDEGFDESGEGEFQSNNGPEAGKEGRDKDEVDFEDDEDDDSPHTLAELGEDGFKGSEPTDPDIAGHANAEDESTFRGKIDTEEDISGQPVVTLKPIEHLTSNGGQVDETHDDEIGYEDDEDEISLDGHTALSSTQGMPTPTAGSAKRPRAEEESFDEAMITRSNDAKRRRS